MSWVAILMGSKSDGEKMSKAAAALDEFGVTSETNVLSAHRQIEALLAYLKDAEQRGVGAYICGAGMAAALPGVVAAHTIKPVIGVPLESGGLGGMDALLSIAQMPPGIPVACVAVNGARNAGLLAVQILAQTDETLAKKLVEFRAELAKP